MPHPGQNLAPAGASAPHAAHLIAIWPAPHCGQKRTPVVTNAPHLARAVPEGAGVAGRRNCLAAFPRRRTAVFAIATMTATAVPPAMMTSSHSTQQILKKTPKALLVSASN